MNLQSIMALPAGKELDHLVSLEVFGVPAPYIYTDPIDGKISGPSHGDPGGYSYGCAPYSSSTAAAMRIVERLRLCVIPTETGWLAGQNDPTGNDYIHGSIVDIRLQSSVEEETIALAVCRSGLLVKRSERYNFDPEPG